MLLEQHIVASLLDEQQRLGEDGDARSELLLAHQRCQLPSGLVRSLPGIATAPRHGASATTRILAGLRKSRLWMRGVPILSLLVLAMTMLCALVAPVLAPYDPIKTNPTKALSAPSLSGHLLGTDHLGRDILSRLI